MMKSLQSMFSKLMEAVRTDRQRAMKIGGGVVLVLLVVLGIRQLVAGDSGRQKVLTRAMLNLVNTESFHTKVDFDFDLPTPAGGQERRLVDVAVDVEGDVLWSEGKPQFVGDMRMETSGRGIILFADGGLRLLPEAVAFRLDNLPTILNPNGNLVEKWTYVDVPLLATNNAEEVRAAMLGVVSDMEYVGKEGDNQNLMHFSRGFTEEQEAALIEVFRQGRSGNRTLHVLARLMRAYNVGSFDVWVNEDEREVEKLTLTFLKPGAENTEPTEAATLTLGFTEYGKTVALEEPSKELTVKPEVFGRIFGRGEVLEALE